MTSVKYTAAILPSWGNSRHLLAPSMKNCLPLKEREREKKKTPDFSSLQPKDRLLKLNLEKRSQWQAGSSRHIHATATTAYAFQHVFLNNYVVQVCVFFLSCILNLIIKTMLSNPTFSFQEEDNFFKLTLKYTISLCSTNNTGQVSSSYTGMHTTQANSTA